MSVPADKLMELMKGPQSAGAPMPVPAAPEPTDTSPPMASPMSTPEPKKGEEMQGRIDVQLGMGMLMGALQKFPQDSKEAKALTEVIRSLGSSFGEMDAKAKELAPADIMQMIQTLPQAGGASAEMRSMAAAPVPGTQNPPLPI